MWIWGTNWRLYWSSPNTMIEKNFKGSSKDKTTKHLEEWLNNDEKSSNQTQNGRLCANIDRLDHTTYVREMFAQE